MIFEWRSWNPYGLGMMMLESFRFWCKCCHLSCQFVTIFQVHVNWPLVVVFFLSSKTEDHQIVLGTNLSNFWFIVGSTTWKCTWKEHQKHGKKCNLVSFDGSSSKWANLERDPSKFDGYLGQNPGQGYAFGHVG